MQIQDKIVEEWELETNMLIFDVHDILIKDNIRANKILLSDYNVFNEEIIRRKELYCIDISEKKSFKKNKMSKFLIKFTNKLDNNIKTNF
jgi:hypothetical protein